MPAHASRRTTLAGGLAALLALAGCDAVRLPGDAVPTPRGPDIAPTPTATEHDEDLVRTSAAAIAGALSVIDLLDAPLRQAAEPVRQMHLVHLEVLAPEGAAGRTEDPPGSTAEAWDLLRRTESELGAQLGDAAVSADSGALARLLATVSASVAQHLAALPEQAPAGGAA